MRDRGHELTDEYLEELEKRMAEEYAEASRDMARKYREYMEAFEEGRKQQYDLWQAGKISKQEYTNWVYRHTMVGKRWQQMADTLAADLERTNEMALALARGQMPDVFALNANYGTYEIEHGGKIDTGFTLYNHDTAVYLMEDRQLMPGPSSAKAAEIAADKALQWNKRKIQSAVLQGVLQGESPYQIADRLRSVAEMNYHASVRYARTMTTSAQNAGRYESFHRADKLGVDLTLEWQATLDGRTRHTHRLLHGMRTTVDKPFVVDGVKIMYPAQSSGAGASDIPQALIWNCRCTILAWVKGFEGDTVKSSPKMGKMTFEEWLKATPSLPSEGKNDRIKSRSGSRQAREKRDNLAKIENASPKPKENSEVVVNLKPIAGEHSRKQDIYAVNPNWDTWSPEWHNNCQRCVTTYEARRRGFDVTALPCYSLQEPIARGTGFMLPYEKGDRHPDKLWHAAGLQFSEARTFTNDLCIKQIETMMNEYGNGSRAIIEGFWKSNGDGHVFIAENVGGKIQFFDPQNRKMDCESYIYDMSPISMGIFRIDDLPFNSYISEVFRNDIEK